MGRRLARRRVGPSRSRVLSFNHKRSHAASEKRMPRQQQVVKVMQEGHDFYANRQYKKSEPRSHNSLKKIKTCGSYPRKNRRQSYAQLRTSRRVQRVRADGT